MLPVVITMTLLLALIVGCRAAVPPSGLTPAEQPGENVVVGVMIGNMANQFHTHIMEGMEVKAKEFPHIEFVYVDGQFDPGRQMSQAENFVAMGVDAIIFMPGDAAAATPLVDMVVEAGIPLIGVNTEVLPEDMPKLTSYAGSNTVESGRILMQAMADLMGGRGNLFEMQGFLGHTPQIDRNIGIHQILAEYPDINLIGHDTGEWSRDVGMTKMENALNSPIGDQIEAVVAHNDEMAIGAMKAIEAAGRKGIKIAGIDATPEALRFVKEGRLSFTVFQDARGQGAKAIEIAAEVVAGNQVEKYYDIPYLLVLPEDVDEFLAKYE